MVLGYEYTDEGMGDLYFDSYMIGNPTDAEQTLKDREAVAAERGVTLAEVPRLLAATQKWSFRSTRRSAFR